MRKLLCLFLILVSVGIVYGQSYDDISELLSPAKLTRGKLKAWTTSEYAPIFNGVNQYAGVAATNMPSGASPRTAMFWVKTHNIASTNKYWFSYGSGSASASFAVGQLNPTLIGVNWFGGSIGANVYPGANLWVHLAFVYPGNSPIGSMTTFLNAEPKTPLTSGNSAFIPNTATQTFIIGNYVSGAFHDNCSLAELSIWNRALSQAEIARYYTKRLKGTEPGLVAYYPLNEPPGSTVFVDKVGGKNAVASNSVQITRRNGYAAPDVRSERYALSFDGVDDYASGTNTQISTYPFTLETWCYPSGTSAYKSIFELTTLATSTPYFFGVYAQNISGAIRVHANRVNNTVETTGRILYSSGLAFPQWLHIAYIASAANDLRLSINGASVGTSTASVQFPSVALDRIHLNRFLVTAYGAAKHAETRIWNTARTQAEIQANLYTQMTGSETGLVYYYRGNEGTGTTLTNLGSAGAAGNLTLYLGPTWVGRDIP